MADQRTLSNSLDLCNKFLADVRAEKQAALKKQATDPSDPTSHPVMKADDGTQPATTGSRAAENKADVTDMLGAGGVTGQEDGNKANAKAPGPDIGTHQMESDEIGGNVQKPKADKDEPKKHTGGEESAGHPSNKTFAEKYSAANDVTTRLESQLAALGIKTAAATTQAQTSTASPAPTDQEKLAAAEKYKEDAEAGYMTAELLAKGLGFESPAEKQAEAVNSEIDQRLGGIVKDAQDKAAVYANYLYEFYHSLQKKAEGEMPPPEAGGPEAGGGLGGAGAPPPEAGGGGGGGGGPEDEEQVLQALAEALAQAGVTPEQLAQAVQEAEASEGGGGAGGGPEAGGGAPPGLEGAGAGAEKMGSANKVVQAVKIAAQEGRKASLLKTLKVAAAK